jgi:hypothetical protein
MTDLLNTYTYDGKRGLCPFQLRDATLLDQRSAVDVSFAHIS